MNDTNIWKMLDTYFKDLPDSLVSHNLESYNEFFKKGIYQIFKEKNPIRLESNYDKKSDTYKNQCEIYLGGRNGDRIFLGKPTIYDDNDKTHYMFPNEARLRNMTYAMPIHYDVEIVYKTLLDNNEKPKNIGGALLLDEANENYNDYKLSYKFDNYKTNPSLLNNEMNNDKFTGGTKSYMEVKEYNFTTNTAREIREQLEKSIKSNNLQEYTETFEKIYLGKFPIMLQSDFCLWNGLKPEIRFTLFAWSSKRS